MPLLQVYGKKLKDQESVFQERTMGLLHKLPSSHNDNVKRRQETYPKILEETTRPLEKWEAGVITAN